MTERERIVDSDKREATAIGPSAQRSPSGATAEPRGTQPGELAARVLKAAWLSVLLGIALELLVIALVTGARGTSDLRPFVADVVQKISWSVLVCVGLAIATIVSKASPGVMGLAGLLAAPLALEMSRLLHKGLKLALQVAGSEPDASLFLLAALALVKAAEYGCLGAVLGWIGRRTTAATMYAAAGLVVGVCFGGVTLALTSMATQEPLSAGRFLAAAMNEILFPVGCSLILFASAAVGKKAPS